MLLFYGSEKPTGLIQTDLTECCGIRSGDPSISPDVLDHHLLLLDRGKSTGTNILGLHVEPFVEGLREVMSRIEARRVPAVVVPLVVQIAAGVEETEIGAKVSVIVACVVGAPETALTDVIAFVVVEEVQLAIRRSESKRESRVRNFGWSVCSFAVSS
jgi:hypothetical protein